MTIYRHARAGVKAKIIHALEGSINRWTSFAMCGKQSKVSWRICSPLNTEIDCPKCIAKIKEAIL